MKRSMTVATLTTAAVATAVAVSGGVLATADRRPEPTATAAGWQQPCRPMGATHRIVAGK